MPSLSQYTNVFDTAIALLLEKGYQVWRDDEQQLYYAERAGWDFAADDPIGLLGLVGIYEAKLPSEYKEYWWRDRAAAGLERDLPPRPSQSYVPVYARKDHDSGL